MLLAKLKYTVAAVTGKADRADWLKQLGASEILDRSAVNDTSAQPLLSSRWAGAVDTVGGNTLATLLRSLTHRGCVAACGLVGGVELPLTVYPFILRGASLIGIDSAQCPREPRQRIWRLLSGEWKLPNLDAIRTVVPLEDIEGSIQQMLAGGALGRVVVRL
jgi:putative YhdH/YhfP family quinone oxidoreductase